MFDQHIHESLVGTFKFSNNILHLCVKDMSHLPFISATLHTLNNDGYVCAYIPILQPLHQLKSSQPKSIQAKPFQVKESELQEIRAGELKVFPDSDNGSSSESDAFTDMEGEYERIVSVIR